MRSMVLLSVQHSGCFCKHNHGHPLCIGQWEKIIRVYIKNNSYFLSLFRLPIMTLPQRMLIAIIFNGWYAFMFVCWPYLWDDVVWLLLLYSRWPIFDTISLSLVYFSTGQIASPIVVISAQHSRSMTDDCYNDGWCYFPSADANQPFF